MTTLRGSTAGAFTSNARTLTLPAGTASPTNYVGTVVAVLNGT
jgi:hypothetical protein